MFDFTLTVYNSKLIYVVDVFFRLSLRLKFLLCIPQTYLRLISLFVDVTNCSSFEFLLLKRLYVVVWVTHVSLYVGYSPVMKDLLQQLALVISYLRKDLCLLSLLINLLSLLLLACLQVLFLVPLSPLLGNSFVCYRLCFDLSC